LDKAGENGKGDVGDAEVMNLATAYVGREDVPGCHSVGEFEKGGVQEDAVKVGF
jgi:hypothetical protein